MTLCINHYSRGRFEMSTRVLFGTIKEAERQLEGGDGDVEAIKRLDGILNQPANWSKICKDPALLAVYRDMIQRKEAAFSTWAKKRAILERAIKSHAN